MRKLVLVVMLVLVAACSAAPNQLTIVGFASITLPNGWVVGSSHTAPFASVTATGPEGSVTMTKVDWAFAQQPPETVAEILSGTTEGITADIVVGRAAAYQAAKNHVTFIIVSPPREGMYLMVDVVSNNALALAQKLVETIQWLKN